MSGSVDYRKWRDELGRGGASDVERSQVVEIDGE